MFHWINNVKELIRYMAFKKETKVKSNFTKITVGLASPEEILENSYGEVTASSASAFSVPRRTSNVIAASTSAFATAASSATDAVWK